MGWLWIFLMKRENQFKNKKVSWFVRNLFLLCQLVSGMIQIKKDIVQPILKDFIGVWTHGDYAERTAQDGFVIHGRSDAVLNPGGVRIGTAEIYRQVETFEEILEALAIGQEKNNDVRVVLFVVMKEQQELTDDLKDQLRKRIKQNTTPRHVPDLIVSVAALPRTLSGKIVELAVRAVVHNLPVKNKEALANPEALEYFKDIPDLQK